MAIPEVTPPPPSRASERVAEVAPDKEVSAKHSFWDHSLFPGPKLVSKLVILDRTLAASLLFTQDVVNMWDGEGTSEVVAPAVEVLQSAFDVLMVTKLVMSGYAVARGQFFSKEDSRGIKAEKIAGLAFNAIFVIALLAYLTLPKRYSGVVRVLRHSVGVFNATYAALAIYNAYQTKGTTKKRVGSTLTGFRLLVTLVLPLVLPVPPIIGHGLKMMELLVKLS